MDPFELTALAECRVNVAAAVERALGVLEAPTPIRLSQWASQHFYLSAESSYVEQRWEAWPPQVAIMDCISHDDVREVDLAKSARVGYTKMILAATAYFAEHKRRNQAVYQPTDEDRDDFVKTELEPMLRDVDAMQRVFPAFLKRHKDNTLQRKQFIGSVLHLRGGKAAKNYRRLTVDVVTIDEVDGFDLDVEGEGSPIALARKRIEGATWPKLICGSTPQLKGFSMIEGQESRAQARFRRLVPCPSCGEEHQLRWGKRDDPFGMKWIGEDSSSVRQLCPHCGALYSQAEYLQVWHRGRWVADGGLWIDEKDCTFRAADGTAVAAPTSVGFHLWTAYCPQAEWGSLVREFQAAVAKAKQGDKGQLKTFVNTTLGESWEEEVERTEPNLLQERARKETPAIRLGVAPRGSLVLVAGVDVQADRWHVLVWGIGRGEEMWTVDRKVIYGNPSDQRDWDLYLLPYLQQPVQHVDGATMRIEAAAIDTGGHWTHQAYNFVRQHPRSRFLAIKGSEKEAQPIKGRSSLVDVSWLGKVIKRGVRLWQVGTDTAKDLIHSRMQTVLTAGPGCVHFSPELDEEFFLQLTAEVRKLVKTSVGDRYRWVKVRPRNEDLDCTVYALFCVQALDLHRYSDALWRRLEEAVQPTLFGERAPDGQGPTTGEAVDLTPTVAAGARGRRVRSAGIQGGI